MSEPYPQEFGDAVVPVVLGRDKNTGVAQITKECRVLRSSAAYLSQAMLSPEGVFFDMSDTSTRTR